MSLRSLLVTFTRTALSLSSLSVTFTRTALSLRSFLVSFGQNPMRHTPLWPCAKPSAVSVPCQPIRNCLSKGTPHHSLAMFRTIAFTLGLPAVLLASDSPVTPQISGEWWTIAGDPDLGPLTTPKQQPVDFGIWRAADGTWQLWSCIRHTNEPGKTRLFHRWEGAKLTDPNWTPKGVAFQADPSLGETQGGLQAPYTLKHDGKYWLFYGDWANICLALSDDGKTFTRYKNSAGNPQLDFPGKIDRDRNGRDPMVLRIGQKWHCYYTAHPGNRGFDYGRTSDDLLHWSEERVVAAGGRSGDGPYTAECPFVVEPRPGHFYLFRTQRYGQNAQTMVYHSRDPLNFGINDDATHYVATLPVAAPEIFQHDGKWFMAALLPTLKGIQVASMEWVSTQR